jgi:O-antigen ligase/tetratricopeptide (TPR) repeat protein
MAMISGRHRDATDPRARSAADAAGERLPSGTRSGELLLKCVDSGIVGTILLVPLLLSGRCALGQLVLVALALWVGLCWCLRQFLSAQSTWVRSPMFPVMAGALLLACLQVSPLPPSLVAAISPRTYETLPMWDPDADSGPSIGVWSTLSFTPAQSRDGIILFTAFVILFVTTAQRVRCVEDVNRLIRWIAISTAGLAVFALVHYFAGNGKYFWFYEHPYARPDTNLAGSFVCRNHFAQFIALGIGPLVWWLQDAIREGQKQRTAKPSGFGSMSASADFHVALRAIALGVTAFAGLLSLSRGGAAAMAVAASVSVWILYRRSLIRGKTLLAVLGTGLFLSACLAIYGYESVANRLEDFWSIEKLDRTQGRRSIWKADLAAVRDYPFIGTGFASHREVCPMYLDQGERFDGFEVTHAESGYIQTFLEAGTPGLLLVLASGALCAYWCITCFRRFTSPRALLCVAAVAPALAASFFHSLFDFVWYIPGCMVGVVIMSACASRLWQWSRSDERQSAGLVAIPRGAWLMAGCCLMVIGLFMLQNRVKAVLAEPHWYRYLRLSKRLARDAKTDRAQLLQSMAVALNQAVRYQPSHARAHSQLASVYIRLFDLPQDSEVLPLDIKQVREAVLASRFESFQAMDEWLTRAFGERHKNLYAAWQHALKAVTLCPLQGDAYLYLGELSFLQGPNSPPKEAFMSQALRVRPYDGQTLLAAGQQAVLAGDIDKAIEFWKAAFKAGRKHRNRLLQFLAGQVPVAFILETFEPDPAAMRHLITLYKANHNKAGLEATRQRYAQSCVGMARAARGKEAATSWLEAATTYQALKCPTEQLRCLEKAVRSDPSCYQARYEFGLCLDRLQQYQAAEEQLTWCLRQKPQDENLRELLETVVDRRLRVTPQVGIGSSAGGQARMQPPRHRTDDVGLHRR